MKPFYYDYSFCSNGEWWLPNDEEMMQGQFPILEEQVDNVLAAVDTVKEQGPPSTAIQAGGAFGLYPICLAHYFDRVVTFEPLKENLECLHENLTPFGDTTNILIVPYPLWSVEGIEMRMDYTIREKKNSYGAHHVTFSKTAPEQSPALKSVTIDHFGFTGIHLIWLDIEGAELHALQGAKKTIMKERPVVVVEDRNFKQMKEFGSRAGDATRWLQTKCDYKIFGKTHADVILVPNESR